MRANGNKTISTAGGWTDIDSTNLAALSLSCTSGDVIELELDCQTYVNTGTGAAGFDFLVTKPDTTTTRASGNSTLGATCTSNQGLRTAVNVTMHYTCGATGTHTFKPQMQTGATAWTVCNASSGNDDTVILFSVKNLGPVTP